MTKPIAFVIAAVFAAFSTASLAQDAKSERKQAKDQYKADRAACKEMKGDEKKKCIDDAKAKRKATNADAKSKRKAEKQSKGSAGGARSRWTPSRRARATATPSSSTRSRWSSTRSSPRCLTRRATCSR